VAKLKVTFLGTGTSQGVPIIGCQSDSCLSLDYRDKRLRTSLLIESEGKTILVDPGPDFRQQMLRHRVKYIDAILVTHEHKDHIAGLDDVRAYNYMQKSSMPLYAYGRVLNHIKTEFAYAFAENKYPGTPTIDLIEVENRETEIAGLPFQIFEVMHARLPVLAFRLFDFVYITDANFISEQSHAVITGCETMVLNALQRQPHPSHFTLEEALQVMERTSPKAGYFTHIAFRMGRHAEVTAILPNHIHLAHDAMVLRL
jgi:phosphoribosyl 1,2-cyclic phosphate phosphodiesterase